MEEVHQAAKALNVSILGGHTEVTSAVRRTVLSVTAVGKVPKGEDRPLKRCEAWPAGAPFQKTGFGRHCHPGSRTGREAQGSAD